MGRRHDLFHTERSVRRNQAGRRHAGMMDSERGDAWRRAMQQALALVWGSTCVVCGDADGPVCDDCAPDADIQRRDVGGLPCFSGARWSEQTSPLMRALKEDGVTRVARQLAPLLTAALECVPLGAGAQGAVLVPVPTRAVADRRRGYRPVEVLLRTAGLSFQRALRVTSAVKDQRELSRIERERNTQGAFAVRRKVAFSQPVILVDDVITTGATLLNSAQTLRSAGATVLASITVLSTPKRLISNS